MVELQISKVKAKTSILFEAANKAPCLLTRYGKDNASIVVMSWPKYQELIKDKS